MVIPAPVTDSTSTQALHSRAVEDRAVSRANATAKRVDCSRLTGQPTDNGKAPLCACNPFDVPGNVTRVRSDERSARYRIPPFPGCVATDTHLVDQSTEPASGVGGVAAATIWSNKRNGVAPDFGNPPP